MEIKIFINRGAPISCETDVVPKEGQQIHVEHHKHNGTYIVNEVHYNYKATQPNNIGSLKLEADIHVYLNEA